MIPKEYEKYKKTVTVSAVNYNPVWGDKAANLEKIKKTVTSAAQMGTNIIAFPELALGGYECSEEARRDRVPCRMHEAIAETIPGPSTEEIAKLAKELGIYVLLGMPERDKRNPKVKYISVAVIGPEGILGSYRKIHLGPLPVWTEDTCFQSGNELPVFETKYGPIGIQICADFWNSPESSRILRLKGARLIFNCTASPVGPGKIERMPQFNATRGHENFAYAISANMVGKEKAMSYYGHSCIAGPAPPKAVQIFAEGGEGEEIVSATLSLERLLSLDAILDLKKWEHLELIANEYRKLAADRNK